LVVDADAAGLPPRMGRAAAAQSDEWDVSRCGWPRCAVGWYETWKAPAGRYDLGPQCYVWALWHLGLKAGLVRKTRRRCWC
jgi:hypothetical protein